MKLSVWLFVEIRSLLNNGNISNLRRARVLYAVTQVRIYAAYSLPDYKIQLAALSYNQM